MASNSANLKYYLGKTNNGFKVYDREDLKFSLGEEVSLELLKEGLRKIQFPKWVKFEKFELNFHRPIGLSRCVSITKEDQVVMVYRKGKEGMTPMVLNRNAEPSEWLSIVLRKDYDLANANQLTLISSFIGSGRTPEPWDKRLRKHSKAKAAAEAFWETHAFIYDESLIDFERTTLL